MCNINDIHTDVSDTLYRGDGKLDTYTAPVTFCSPLACGDIMKSIDEAVPRDFRSDSCIFLWLNLVTLVCMIPMGLVS